MNVAVNRRTSVTAVVSLVFGVLAWFALPLVGAIVAVICGHAARAEIRASGGQTEGAGLALAGLLLGWTHLAILLLAVLVFIVLPLSVLGGLGVFGHWLQHWQNCGGTAI
ncbi:MAG: DUF4190 domain-containing protein [Sinobacteraceae bacterium]|nr:DUF4190 domain-containing protein [Nevskia sp.]MDI3260226.1 DUF4190 domain-containing protein [Nevskiaceae bacterium]